MNVQNFKIGFTLFVVSLIGMGCASMEQGANNKVPIELVASTPLALKSDRAVLTNLGPNNFLVQCDKIEAIAAKQTETNWCWAACAQMLFNYYGVTNITQEEIVEVLDKKAKQGQDSEQANLYEIWLAMNPDMLLELARRKATWAGHQKPNEYNAGIRMNLVNLGDVVNSMSNPSTDALVQEISSGNPVVVGLHGGQWGGGHVVLAYGVSYSRLHPKGEAQYRDTTETLFRFLHRFQINKIMVIDPQPLRGQKQLVEITGDELKTKKDFSVGKTDARNQLMAYFKVNYPSYEEWQELEARSHPLK